MENLTAAEAVERDPVGAAARHVRGGLRGAHGGLRQARRVPPVQPEVQAEIDRAEGRPRPMVGIERFAFYDFARTSYAVIQTGERRFWGCFMLRKGVIPPDA